MNKLTLYFLLTELMTEAKASVALTKLLMESYSEIYHNEATFERLRTWWIDLTNEIDLSLIPKEYLEEFKP